MHAQFKTMTVLSTDAIYLRAFMAGYFFGTSPINFMPGLISNLTNRISNLDDYQQKRYQFWE